MAKVYIAGHMLNRGSQLQRAEERAMIEELGHEFYNPMDNKEINDKASAVQEGLAERILRHDTDAINWCDTVVIEPDSSALGTHVELGQILGQNDLAAQILQMANVHFENDQTMEHDGLLIADILNLCRKQVERKVYPHLEDIRLLAPTGDGQRSTFGLNAYVLGACLKLTDGKGLYTMQEIKDALSK